MTTVNELLEGLKTTWPGKDVELVLRCDGSSLIVDKEEFPEIVGGVTQRFDNLNELFDFLDI